MYLIRRGSPCCVRRSSRDKWRRHVCSVDRTELVHRIPHNDGPAWAFEVNGWQMLVEPSFLERSEAFRSTCHVGITGTREGLTDAQRAAMRNHLTVWLMYSDWHPITYHHGGCVGADREAHELVRELYGQAARIVIHPASDQPPSLCDWEDADELMPLAKSLERNKAIVASITQGSVLIALPKENLEQQRSGTWSTVRQARRVGKSVAMFGPDVKLPKAGEIRGRAE